MTPDRIIVLGATQTQQIDNAVFELGRAQANYGAIVLTSQNTSIGSIGTSELYAREDHVHPSVSANTVAPVDVATSSGGLGASFARGDHVHLAPCTDSAALVSWSTSTAGSSSDLIRGNHVHYLNPGVYTNLGHLENTLYTNNGSAPIYVLISVKGDGYFQVDGADVCFVPANSVIGTFVPPSSTYKLTSTVAILNTWWEYVF